MKFLCEQCKAKYQISDDKVAGKTVRMKCRKCGHMIEVRSEVTESSVAKAAPTADDAARPGAGIRTSLAPKPPARPALAGAPALKGQMPQTPQPPRAPTASGPPAKSSGIMAPRPPTGVTDKRSEGSLAGAFQKSIKKEKDEESAAHELASVSTSNEWYVAINGVPVGPVRVSELRRKASVGAVTEDSLVWQEGLEEWRPVRSVTELALLVREAAATGRPSLTPAAPPGSTPPPASTRSPSVRPPSGERRSVAPPRPAAARAADAPSARNNVVPFTGGGARFATAEKLELDEEADKTSVQEMPSAFRPAPQPHAAVAPPPPLASPPAGLPGGAERSSLVAADPFAMPAPPATSSPFAHLGPQMAGASLTGPVLAAGLSNPVSLPAPSVVAPPPRRSIPWIPIAMVGAAVSFGVAAAVILLVRSPAPPPQVIVQMPSAAPVTPPPPTSAAAVVAEEFPATAPSTEKAPIARGGPVAPRPSAAPPPRIEGLDGVFGGGPARGPSAGGSGGGGGGGGGQLSGGDIEGVVRSKSVGVRRSCWERSGSTTSANVTCRVVIGGNGQVQSASATGNDPALAKCIENAVRSWSFPAAGGTTTVDIPFHFVKQ